VTAGGTKRPESIVVPLKCNSTADTKLQQNRFTVAGNASYRPRAKNLPILWRYALYYSARDDAVVDAKRRIDELLHLPGYAPR